MTFEFLITSPSTTFVYALIQFSSCSFLRDLFKNHPGAKSSAAVVTYARPIF